MFLLTLVLAAVAASPPPACEEAAFEPAALQCTASGTRGEAPIAPDADQQAPAQSHTQSSAECDTQSDARSFADFRPSLHGFAFVNSFRGSPLPIPLGAVERRLNIPERFGLCGGMCFAAADYFLAGRPLLAEIPQSQPPARGTPLYDYLYARQAASLAPLALMFTRFVEWMDLPEEGEDGTHARTAAELPSIIEGIEAGEPVLLGLVLVSTAEGGQPWRNHQVLAWGMSQKDDPPTLRIYDPNYPGRDDVVIRWCHDDQRWDRIVPDHSQTHIRGFFRMPYQPVEPPRIEGNRDGE